MRILVMTEVPVKRGAATVMALRTPAGGLSRFPKRSNPAPQAGGYDPPFTTRAIPRIVKPSAAATTGRIPLGTPLVVAAVSRAPNGP